MKKAYILLTNSNSIVSKVIEFTTADEFTHVSIAFDDNMDDFHTFARKYIHTPLPGGLKRESLYSGFFEKYDDIPCALYELEMSDESYDFAKNLVEEMIKNEVHYKYNVIGLLLCRLGIAYDRDKHYFCSEFVGEVLHESGAIKMEKKPSLLRPNDFLSVDEFTLMFKGTLKELRECKESGEVKFI